MSNYKPRFPKPPKRKRTAKRIRVKSDKQFERDKKYQAAKKQKQAQRLMCECGCGEIGTEIHHIAGRVGPLLYDISNLMVVTEECHRWIHANPEESYRLGYLRKRIT